MWDFNLSLDIDSETPIFRQIAHAIANDITAGRLRPGDNLPGTRRLAQELGVHRNTVVTAYERLVAEGWIVTRPAGGTYIADHTPDPTAKSFAPSFELTAPSRPGFVLAPSSTPPGSTGQYGWQGLEVFNEAPPQGRSGKETANNTSAQHTVVLTSGAPDWRLFPASLLARAMRRVLSRHAAAAMTLGHPTGHPRTRRALAAMLAARRGLLVEPNNIFITRGFCMAMRLLVHALLRPGDAVAVETPGYPAAWEALHAGGAKLVPVPVDHHGLRLDALQAALQAHPNIRALYVTPHHQYPTMASMPPARRLALLQLAADHRLAILEDDYDHEFHYEGQPLRPLASADRFGVVVYMGSLSKLAAPGLRLGFIVGPEQLIGRLRQERLSFDPQGDMILELAIADLSEDGEINSYVRRVRPVYRGRRDAFVAALRRYMPDLRFAVPPGGLSLWAELADAAIMQRWWRACAGEGVMFHTEQRYRFDAAVGSAARLGFSTLTEEQVDDVGVRMARAYHRACAETGETDLSHSSTQRPQTF